MSDWNDEVETVNVAGGDVSNQIQLPEIKLFGRWSTQDVEVGDMSLTVNMKYIQVNSN